MRLSYWSSFPAFIFRDVEYLILYVEARCWRIVELIRCAPYLGDVPVKLRPVPDVWGASNQFDDSPTPSLNLQDEVLNILEDESRETTPTTQPHRYNAYLPSGSRMIHDEDCECIFCELRKTSDGRFTANMAHGKPKKTLNTKTKSSSFYKEHTLLAGMPTPVVTIRLKTTTNGSQKLSYMRCIPDTGASIDVISSKAANKMGLEVILDEQEEYSLLNAENNEIQIEGITKLAIQNPEGG